MNEYKWWYSTNEECYIGPCETREDAIRDGLVEYCGEEFYILEASQAVNNLRIEGWEITSLLEEENRDNFNYDLGGPDGLFNKITGEQYRILGDAVSKAIQDWIDTEKIPVNPAWVFLDTRSRELIKGTANV